jgi:hypothetical protein
MRCFKRDLPQKITGKEPSYIIMREMVVDLKGGPEIGYTDTTTRRALEPQNRRDFFFRNKFNPNQAVI